MTDEEVEALVLTAPCADLLVDDCSGMTRTAVGSNSGMKASPSS